MAVLRRGRGKAHLLVLHNEAAHDWLGDTNPRPNPRLGVRASTEAAAAAAATAARVAHTYARDVAQ